MNKFRSVVAFGLTVLLAVSLTGCMEYSSNILEVTNAGPGSVSTTAFQPVITTSPITNFTTASQVVTPTDIAATTAAQTPETTAAAAPADPSGWSTAEIVSYAKECVTKTKAFAGNVSAKHTENVNVTVTKAPGGSAVQSIVNSIISGVIEPTDETLNFSGGKATNSEGESVQLLLPTNSAFTLDPAGVVSASASLNGANTVLTMNLVSEEGSLTVPPVYNAQSIGYLDASTLDLSAVTINYLNVTYTGSTIVMTINPEGYVVSADYSVPLKISAEGKALMITAQVEAEGLDSEKWEFSW